METQDILELNNVTGETVFDNAGERQNVDIFDGFSTFNYNERLVNKDILYSNALFGGKVKKWFTNHPVIKTAVKTAFGITPYGMAVNLAKAIREKKKLQQEGNTETGTIEVDGVSYPYRKVGTQEEEVFINNQWVKVSLLQSAAQTSKETVSNVPSEQTGALPSQTNYLKLGLIVAGSLVVLGLGTFLIVRLTRNKK